uniref:Uncharacterized protein n=1 Tax=Setaria viridis TaxID=4556 RepID=A0A4U6VF23_SETVI|nr:hypothetical protein SEVIR_3G294050v2 [Setaria viridis]
MVMIISVVMLINCFSILKCCSSTDLENICSHIKMWLKY